MPEMMKKEETTISKEKICFFKIGDLRYISHLENTERLC